VKPLIRYCALALAIPWAAGPAPADALAPNEWTFGVYLDEKRIGTHRFAIEPDSDGRVRVTSDARFDVKVLGVTVFRYRHTAQELWHDGCLVALETTTQVNRKQYRVAGAPSSEGFEIATEGDAGARREVLPACVATYAYWNPDLLSRHAALLNAQTGDYQPVSRLVTEAGTLELAGEGFTIGLRYRDGDGLWEGLRTTTRDGRALDYRLDGRPGTFL
jgi:hypothetical protein